MAFQGFSPATFDFLRALSANNTKAFFDAHRDDYEACYRAPALAFIEAMAPRLSKIDESLVADPKANGSLFRVNRDTRFSKDKTPYKDHIDMWFYSGDRKAGSGCFLRLTAEKVHLGAGLHGFTKEGLSRYREAVADDTRGAELTKILKKCERAGYVVQGESYKKVPRGYDPEHPRAQLLRHASLSAMLEVDHPAEIHSAKFATWCAAHWTKLAPVHRYVRDVIA